jgi:pimeloyl-ACP methyl ester carboxylesterase
MTPKTIVFIHGMFVTPACWEAWIAYYQDKGYTCLAPAWPGREQPVESLRANHPDPQLGRLTLADLVEYYAGIIADLGEKPVLIGHSMGGLIVQLLLQRDLGCAGVAIDSAPPAGVITTRWSFLKSNWPLINPFISKYRPYYMPFEHFQYTFVHTLPLEQQQAAYAALVVPESRQVAQGTLSAAASVDFERLHVPLLLIAGSDDRIIPAGLNRANQRKYDAALPAITDFKEFPGRTHFIIGQPGWSEVADYISEWLGYRQP